MNMVITGANSITSVGYSAEVTAASVRACICRLSKFSDFNDVQGNPISVALIGSNVDADKENDTTYDGKEDYKEYDGEEDQVSHITRITKDCFKILLDNYFQNSHTVSHEIYVLLGVASVSRPGPRYEGKNGEIADLLVNIAKKRTSKATCEIVPTGSASVMRCVEIASQILKSNEDALLIIGGIDSLLAEDTLTWYEDDERLKSDTLGRNHGFSPGEAVGFTIIESLQGARRRKKKPLVEIIGLGLANEPAPFLSSEPSRGEGLTTACRIALADHAGVQNEIATVMSDLNGDFFSMKEWSYTEIRCFGDAHDSRTLLHPADCLGSVGAAFGAILMNIAVVGLVDGWLENNCMVFCSDDGPERGAVVLRSIK